MSSLPPTLVRSILIIALYALVRLLPRLSLYRRHVPGAVKAVFAMLIMQAAALFTLPLLLWSNPFVLILPEALSDLGEGIAAALGILWSLPLGVDLCFCYLPHSRRRSRFGVIAFILAGAGSVYLLVRAILAASYVTAALYGLSLIMGVVQLREGVRE